MILLTRLDRREIALNSDRIAWIDACPDTTLRLTDGGVLVVLEPIDEVVRRVVAYRGALLREAGLAGLLTVSSRETEAPRQASSSAPSGDERLEVDP